MPLFVGTIEPNSGYDKPPPTQQPSLIYVAKSSIPLACNSYNPINKFPEIIVKHRGTGVEKE